jgi:hypothetical protein
MQLVSLGAERSEDDLVQLTSGLSIQQLASGGIVGDHVDHHGPRFCIGQALGLGTWLDRHRETPFPHTHN